MWLGPPSVGNPRRCDSSRPFHTHLWDASLFAPATFGVIRQRTEVSCGLRSLGRPDLLSAERVGGPEVGTWSSVGLEAKLVETGEVGQALDPGLHRVLPLRVEVDNR